MTADELKHVGARYLYWPYQSSIDDNRPYPLICQRADIDGEAVTIHGIAFGGANGHWQVGDPLYTGMDDAPRAALVASPTVGCCTMRPVDAIG